MPAPKTTHVDPASTFAVFIAAPSPVESPQAKSARALERRLGVDLRERDLRHHRVLGERRGAHEVADRLAARREPRRAVGQVALVLLLADREAEVRAVAQAVDALAALRREERDDVVAGRDRRRRPRRPARRRPRPRGRAPSARSPTGRRPTPCTGRCGRRRRRRAARAPRRRSARRGRPPARRAARRTPRGPRP